MPARILLVHAAFLLLAAGTMAAAPQASDPDVAAHVRTFRAFLAAAPMPEPGEIRSRYEQTFSALLRPVTRLSTAELAEWYEAAYEASFYTADPVPSRDLLAITSELQARDAATQVQWVQTYDALLSARLIEQAASVHAARDGQGMGTLPRFAPQPDLPDGAPSLWRVDTGTSTLHREAVDLQPPRIVVVAHPHCGFCRRAAAAIATDADLRRLMQQHATWLAPASGPFAFDAVLAWNRQHPYAPIAYAWREQDWPMIEDWATPVFHFIRDGQVQRRIQGWPGEGRLDELRAAAAALGLATTGSLTAPRSVAPSPRPEGHLQ